MAVNQLRVKILQQIAQQKIAMATYLLIVAFLEVNLTLTFNIDQHCLLIYRHLNTYLQCTIFCIDSGMQNSHREARVYDTFLNIKYFFCSGFKYSKFHE